MSSNSSQDVVHSTPSHPCPSQQIAPLPCRGFLQVPLPRTLPCRVLEHSLLDLPLKSSLNPPRPLPAVRSEVLRSFVQSASALLCTAAAGAGHARPPPCPPSAGSGLTQAVLGALSPREPVLSPSLLPTRCPLCYCPLHAPRPWPGRLPPWGFYTG